MKEPKDSKEKPNENCTKEASRNSRGCFKIICDANEWNFVEVMGSKSDKAPDMMSGVIMGEPRLIEFVGKAIVAYQGGAAVMEMMKEMILKDDDKPTTH